MPATDLVDLGQALCVLSNPQVTAPDTIFRNIRELRRLTESLGLSRTHIASGPLAAIASIPTLNNRPNGTAVAQIQAYLGAISATAYDEVTGLSIVRTTNVQVADEFADLASRLPLNATQSTLIEEAVSAFRASAFRACMVMTWNGIYDYIRQWVFDTQLSAFNGSLTTEYVRRNGTPVYAPIQDYDDFLTGKPSERTVIDTCYHANIFGERLRDELRQLLRRRNDSAHATNRMPDATQALAYAHDLLDIATGRPFV
ncbi:hypothetical protein [Rubinisphaera margarita]|uniref:hypothetical protein n=1 Tax=Rubinisphaera margarita TaxID=2909586 RepID=UPI001EE931B4|nr:hypothetical protein [Rubinisphaera margarita]MCG6156904.1 hypothetical protein [Rubinisphaera margarita]